MARHTLHMTLGVVLCIATLFVAACGLGRTDGATGSPSGANRLPSVTPTPRPGSHVHVPYRPSQNPAYQALQTTGGWPEFGYDATGARYNPSETILSPSNVSGLVIAWSAAAGDSSSATSTPVVANGDVYVAAADGLVRAYNAETGTPAWSQPALTGATWVGAAPAAMGNSLYVATGDVSRVYAFAQGSGVEQGERLLDDNVGGWLTTATGVVYAGAQNHLLYAISTSTGKVLWQFRIGAAGWVTAVVGGTVYAMSLDSRIYAINASNGAQIWNYLATEPIVSVAVVNGVVYADAEDSSVYALDASTGALLWRIQLATDSPYSPPYYDTTPLAVANGTVFVGVSDYFSGSSALYGLDASTGQQRWSPITADQQLTAPAVANGVVYFAAYDGTLYVADATSGNLLHTYSLPCLVTAAPTVSNGMVYVACHVYDSTAQSLYAYELP